MCWVGCIGKLVHTQTVSRLLVQAHVSLRTEAQSLSGDAAEHATVVDIACFNT